MGAEKCKLRHLPAVDLKPGSTIHWCGPGQVFNLSEPQFSSSIKWVNNRTYISQG